MVDIISVLIGKINDTRKEIADTVSAGNGVSTFDKYQRLVGRYEGLQITLDLINDILTEDDEDNAA